MLARASGSVICPFNSILGLVAQLGAHHIRIVGVEGSNPFESTTASEQSPLCSGAFYFTGNRKHHPLRSLAPPFQIEPVLCTGLRFGFLCPKLKNMLLLFEQASYRLLRLFMPVAKKSECAHSAAPPFKPATASLGCGFANQGTLAGAESALLPCFAF